MIFLFITKYTQKGINKGKHQIKIYLYIYMYNKMTFKEEIETVVKHKRPKFNQSSITTYVSILFNFQKITLRW